jgi:hypothetical protein
MMNENDLNIELIANINDNRFAIAEFVVDDQQQNKQEKNMAIAKIKIVNESFFRTIQLTDKGYKQSDPIDRGIDNNNNNNNNENDDVVWFETLSTLLQSKSESFQNQMMQTLFSKLIEIEK